MGSRPVVCILLAVDLDSHRDRCELESRAREFVLAVTFNRQSHNLRVAVAKFREGDRAERGVLSPTPPRAASAPCVSRGPTGADDHVRSSAKLRDVGSVSESNFHSLDESGLLHFKFLLLNCGRLWVKTKKQPEKIRFYHT